MRVLIIGRGVVGTIYGWALSKAGIDVIHVVRKERVSTDTLDLLDLRAGYPKHTRTTYAPKTVRQISRANDFDLVIVATSHYQAVEALQQYLPDTRAQYRTEVGRRHAPHVGPSGKDRILSSLTRALPARIASRTHSPPTCYLVWNASPRRRTADPQPDPRLLGRVGRMGARRHGFVHLRPGPGAGVARSAAALRPRRHPGQHRLLRRRRSSPCSWSAGASRFSGDRSPIASAACARWCSPSSATPLFTFLGCAAATVWQLAVFRFLAGVGIGGEWTIGGVFVAEEWPESRA